MLLSVSVRLACPVLLGACLAGWVHAGGDVVFYRQGERPDPAAVARVLHGTPGAPEARKVRMRGLRLQTDEVQEQQLAADTHAVAALAAAPASVEAAPRSIALQVQFAYNSSEIPREMRPSLDAVAQGIQLAGAAVRVVIEGHTDAHGSDEYNLLLSRRRAAAVKQYLVAHHGIPPETLVVLGRGESVPLIPGDAYAPENRRVEFHAAD
jgi:outer membrane protein OmpA-like peptidoglycan-associated protein